ncbi:SRR1-like protein [Dysidea avara]|uniref:SRR1-like protein n=1 Tax=Dysidea avara TaxID=196820 RepID=UPI003333EF53
MEDDGFQLVSRKKAARASKVHTHNAQGEYDGMDGVELTKRIDKLKLELIVTKFYKDTVTTIQTAILEVSPPSHLLCYGIGRIGSCHIARTQFVLLLLLRDHLKLQESSLYDPVLHKEEVTAIEQHGVNMLTCNEGCRRTLSQPTLVYMLHCSSAMYNNLLWANWNKMSLTNVILVSNKLSNYQYRYATQELKEKWRYIYHAITLCREVTIHNNYEDGVVFNDIAVHVFPQHQLSTTPGTVWENCIEPSVDKCDNEIIL